MKIARSAAELAVPGRKACVAIGFFDGVHLGHQQIIHQAESDARQHEALSVVVSFDRHPASLVAPETAPALIQTLDHRLRTIGSLSPHGLLLLAFDRALREQPAEAFIRWLHAELGGIHSICIGADFHFGYKRGGNVALMEALGAELGFRAHGIRAVALDGRTVSSTRIRAAIREGRLEGVSEMLGRAYSVESRVMRGDQLGHQLGFPTANLDVAGLVLPPDGVYAVLTKVGDVSVRGVANIGVRPTVTSGAAVTRLEVHLLDYSGDLYDQRIEVTFMSRLRAEQRFDSVGQLQAQIRKDIVEARRRFA